MRNAVSVLAIGAIVTFGLVAVGCTKRVEEPAKPEFTPSEAPPLPPGPDKLVIDDTVVGTGPEAKKGDSVKVHYTGTLMNGKQFDSSVGKDPFPVTIGAGGVIKGWDEGLPGMRVGGKRKLTIPWQSAYGDKGSGPMIPPKAALKFDIELLEIVAPDDKKDAGSAKPALKAAGKDAGAKK